MLNQARSNALFIVNDLQSADRLIYKLSAMSALYRLGMTCMFMNTAWIMVGMC